jgi:predicted ATPase with chaperone activity
MDHTRMIPRPPESLHDAGLSDELVAGLVLKALHVRGVMAGFALADALALPFSILDGVVRTLQDERLVEVHETHGPSRGEYAFRLTGDGRRRAQEELELSRYVGPAPVPFEAFLQWVEAQAVQNIRVSREELRNAFSDVVLPDPLFDQLGPAVNSGRSLFLYGAPGNGKTLLAERIAELIGQSYYVPYAVLVDGSVMIVYDPVLHRSAEGAGAEDGGEAPGIRAESLDGPTEEGLRTAAALADVRQEIFRSLPEHDRRFAHALRPVVVTGGELTLEQLDLQWDPSGRMYQAPPQLKAAGGVLVIDDLGRQRVPVQELLNRWVVPLEHRRDYLTLRSGRKISVPFDCFVVFSTNLEPRSLADEAFLRRIHYKIEVPDPDREEYERIFKACCDQRGITFHAPAVDVLFDEIYDSGSVEPRRCHPRDVLNHLQDLAAYRGESADLNPKRLQEACASYFLSEA